MKWSKRTKTAFKSCLWMELFCLVGSFIFLESVTQSWADTEGNVLLWDASRGSAFLWGVQRPVLQPGPLFVTASKDFTVPGGGWKSTAPCPLGHTVPRRGVPGLLSHGCRRLILQPWAPEAFLAGSLSLLSRIPSGCRTCCCYCFVLELSPVLSLQANLALFAPASEIKAN